MNKVLFKNKYIICDTGEIININTAVSLKLMRNRKNKSITVNLNIDGYQQTVNARRLIAKTLIPIPKELKNYNVDDLVVQYKGDWEDLSASNLYWTTKQENIKIRTARQKGKPRPPVQPRIRKISLFNMKEGIELQFDSVLEAATFLKSKDDNLPSIKSIKSALYYGLKNRTRVYEYIVRNSDE